MMGVMARLQILWFGLLVLFPRGVGWSTLSGILPCCLVLLLFGLLNDSLFRLVLLVLRILLIGLTLSVSWGTGLLAVLILRLVVFLVEMLILDELLGWW